MHQPQLKRSVIFTALLIFTFLPFSSSGAVSSDLRLAIQPVLSQSRTQKVFEPLARYLEERTGRKIKIVTMPNFLAYWDLVRHPGQYDLSLDAAHFTDYRAHKENFEVLAKIPDFVSYSLVVRQENLVFEPSELVAKTVATLGAPSIGAARLNAMFPNPMRQPSIIDVPSSEVGMKMLLDGKVYAAILPTPVVSQYMSNQAPIAVVSTTEPIPHIAVSASKNLDANTRGEIRQALIDASKTEEGRAMLQKIGFPKFDPASAKIYQGQARILKEYWGY
ncbi:MAG: phosphate/phosphite/phosphonate ABC transporter substrate-binding protein [Acidiferrobacterales bacterium]